MTVAGRPRGFDADLALDAAVGVFWRRGYDSASLSELTAAMGINRPSLYAAFGDKAQLFQTALRRYVERNMGYVTDALDRPTAREVATAFLTGNAVAVTMPGHPAGCLSVQAAVATEGSTQLASLTENRATIQALFADRFRRAIDEGDLAGNEDPDELAAFLITVTSGFAIRAADGTPRETLLAMARRTMASFPATPGSPHNSDPEPPTRRSTTMPEHTSSLSAAREQALAVRSLYEVLEKRFNGKVWSLHELMIGFSNDVGYIGRLLLAHDGTWGIDGDPRAELGHKFAESMWWTFVLADKLDIDLDEAYSDTMANIRAGLEATIARTEPESNQD